MEMELQEPDRSGYTGNKGRWVGADQGSIAHKRAGLGMGVWRRRYGSVCGGVGWEMEDGGIMCLRN